MGWPQSVWANELRALNFLPAWAHKKKKQPSLHPNGDWLSILINFIFKNYVMIRDLSQDFENFGS